MLFRRTLQIFALGLAVIASSIGLCASKDFVPPRAENANTYASKDAHPNEKVTAAIELYNTAPKDQIFITPYNQEDILPVLLVVSNDGDQPIALTGMRAELVTMRNAKLESLGTDDVFRRVAHINGSSTAPERIGPIPLSGNKNKKAQKQYQEIIDARFAAEAVEPHTTRSGFLFFDIAGVKQPVDGAHIYLTGLRDANGNELLYFEIPVLPDNAARSSSSEQFGVVAISTIALALGYQRGRWPIRADCSLSEIEHNIAQSSQRGDPVDWLEVFKDGKHHPLRPAHAPRCTRARNRSRPLRRRLSRHAVSPRDAVALERAEAASRSESDYQRLGRFDHLRTAGTALEAAHL